MVPSSASSRSSDAGSAWATWCSEVSSSLASVRRSRRLSVRVCRWRASPKMRRAYPDVAATTTSSIDHWVLMAHGFCPSTGWMTWAVPMATDTAMAMRSAKPKPREKPATMMDGEDGVHQRRVPGAREHDGQGAEADLDQQPDEAGRVAVVAQRLPQAEAVVGEDDRRPHDDVEVALVDRRGGQGHAEGRGAEAHREDDLDEPRLGVARGHRLRLGGRRPEEVLDAVGHRRGAQPRGALAGRVGGSGGASGPTTGRGVPIALDWHTFDMSRKPRGHGGSVGGIPLQSCHSSRSGPTQAPC